MTLKTLAWDFLVEDPVEKTIGVNREALIVPLVAEGDFDLVDYTGEIDLFDDKVPDAALIDALAVIAIAGFRRFLVATEKVEGAEAFLDNFQRHAPAIGNAASELAPLVGAPAGAAFIPKPEMEFLPNLAIAAWISNQESADLRLPVLLRIPAAIHVARHAPASGPIDYRNLPAETGLHRSLGWTLDVLRGVHHYADGRIAGEASGALDWILISGTGRGWRNSLHPDWIRQAIRQADPAGVPVYFEHWGQRRQGEAMQADAATREHFAGKLREVNFAGTDLVVAVPLSDEDPASNMVKQPASYEGPAMIDGQVREDLPKAWQGEEA